MIDPTGSQSGRYRVLRGGSFLNLPSIVRSSYRYLYVPAYRLTNVGFRLVMNNE